MALILVVDDRPVNREFLTMLLGYAGHRVIEAADGDAALARTRQERPDLIISDIVMPRMDGVEFARRLRADAQMARIPLIFYTASYRLGDALSMTQPCGACAVLAKPSKPQAILDAVATALGHPAAPAPKPSALAAVLPAAGQDLNLSLRLSMLIELGLDLAAERDAQRLLDLACRAAQDIFGTEYAAVGIVDEATGRLSRFATRGLAATDAWFVALDTRAGILGSVLREGQPRRLRGLSGNAAAGGLPAGHPPLDALMAVPLATAIRCHGWLYVANRTGRGFDESDEQIALTLAAKLALAHENLMLFDTVQHHAAALAADAEALRAAKAAAEQASMAKTAFLANMSHEIRTPLSVIIGLGRMLRRDLAEPAGRQRLDQLCATSDHLLALLTDVLDLSKVEAGQLALEPADFSLDAVTDKLRRMIEARAHEKGLSLTMDVAPHLHGALLRGDDLRLAQVLINLCGNAVKFTDRGTVRLTIACLAEDAASVSLHFRVADTGIGIAPAEQARLFQPFTQIDATPTRTRGGTGLGLSISQHLVALMGGTIRVDSQPGVGSSFAFDLVLPRAVAANAAAAAAPAASAATGFHGRRILCAEDHPLNQEILLGMLEDLGCDVDVAADGAEAVARAQDRRYDLILMDMQMPRMDGLAATRAIRALPGHGATPIVALTANAFAEDRARCLAAGMNDHLGKPATRETLAAVLGRWLPDLAAPPACGH